MTGAFRLISRVHDVSSSRLGFILKPVVVNTLVEGTDLFDLNHGVMCSIQLPYNSLLEASSAGLSRELNS
ncbi:hypothetical protein AAHC03_05109 [Spirometra sp. Aus1]